MSKRDVVVKADKVRKWHKLGRFAKIAILLLLLLLIVIYIVLEVLFNGGSFVVALDDNDAKEIINALLSDNSSYLIINELEDKEIEISKTVNRKK